MQTSPSLLICCLDVLPLSSGDATSSLKVNGGFVHEGNNLIHDCLLFSAASGVSFPAKVFVPN